MKTQSSRPLSHTSTYYRADIDGLRAISVLAVILYHAGIYPFGSGFVTAEGVSFSTDGLHISVFGARRAAHTFLQTPRARELMERMAQP